VALDNEAPSRRSTKVAKTMDSSRAGTPARKGNHRKEGMAGSARCGNVGARKATMPQGCRARRQLHACKRVRAWRELVLALSCHGGATALKRGPVQVWPAAWGGLIVTRPRSEPDLAKGELGTETSSALTKIPHDSPTRQSLRQRANDLRLRWASLGPQRSPKEPLTEAGFAGLWYTSLS